MSRLEETEGIGNHRTADLADDGLMRVHVAKATRQPIAICISIAEPALQLGPTESVYKGTREVLAHRCHDIGRLTRPLG